MASAGPHAIVLANGTEGEPLSAKDKVLMAQAPHLVLDGAVIAAGLVGAGEAVIVAHPAVSDIVAAAAAQRRRARADRVRLRVVPAADRFVAGEASAVMNWIGSGVPKPTPPRLSEHGLHGRPTLVQNVETLAHLALIARHGADWFRAVGTQREPGSMLVTLAGAVRRPGVYEIAIGAAVTAVLDQAGGPDGRLGAFLIGGYFGSWVEASRTAQLALSTESLGAVGASVGAGLILALPADACGLVAAARVTRYLADESAGQCGPCVFGLDAVAAQMERLAAGRGPRAAGPTWTGSIAGSASSGRAAALASTRTARSRWCAARWRSSAPKSTSTRWAGAAEPGGSRDHARPSRRSAAGEHDRLRGSRAVR